MLDRLVVKKPGGNPCFVGGDRLYLIGGQDGSFPERGEHMPYEMWGIWAPPVKVFNGFWFEVDGEWLVEAETFGMYPYGAEFGYGLKNGMRAVRFQYVPDGMCGFVASIRLENDGDEEREVCLKLGVQSNLMPVWLSERAGIEDGKDLGSFSGETNTVYFEDERNDWCSGVRACGAVVSFSEKGAAPVNRRENPKACYCEMELLTRVKAKEKKETVFCFAASVEGRSEVEELLREMGEESVWPPGRLLAEKRKRYELLSGTAALSFEKEPVWEQMYEWSKYINDWMIREVPGGERGLAAGYPEFPWWFGNDTNYMIPALLLQGETEICKDTLRLLKRKSMEVNGNGRVVHEISSNGIVFYEGMTTETPQFLDSVWQIYCFSADRGFLEEMYDFCLLGMEWIESISEHGFPGGYGISEIAGLDCLCCDTALLAIRGYEVMGLMAKELGESEKAARYREKFKSLLERFEEEFYIPELGVYGDMAATKEEIIARAETWQYTLKSFPISEEDTILGESSCKKDKSPEDEQAKLQLKERMQEIIRTAKLLKDGERRPYCLFGLGHSAIPVELGYLSGERGRAVLHAMEKLENKNKLRIEKMMPIGVGRKIRAYGNVGMAEQIAEGISEVAAGFSAVMPGATSEIYPEAGCFVQGWNSLVTMWPYAGVIFGINPKASEKVLELKPCVCKRFDGMRVTGVLIGGEGFDLHLTYQNTQPVISVRAPKDWEVRLNTEEKVLLRVEYPSGLI